MKVNFIHFTIYQKVCEFANRLKAKVLALMNHFQYAFLAYRAARRKHIKQKFIATATLSVLCFSAMGCGSILTHMSPLESELVTETSVKSPSGIQYTCEQSKNSIYLTRTPSCEESAKTSRVAQKRSEWALPIACGELILFGFGFVDMATMYAISEDSKVEYLLGNYDTGLSVPCGKAEAASGETMVIKNDTEDIYHEVVTDNDGSIDLIPILGTNRDKKNFRIYLKSDPTVSFSFVY
jgi:hypothetical protein